MHLTKTLIEKTPYPAEKSGGAFYLWHDDPRGLGVRIYPSGLRSWVVTYRQKGRRRFQTLGPVAATSLAVAFFGETLRADRIAAIAVVLAGVAMVVAPGKVPVTGRGPRHDFVGYSFGLIAAFGQGAGLVLAKHGMADLPITSASFVRLVASTASLVVLMAWGPRLRSAIGALRNRENLRRIAPPTLLGSYIAILLMMAGVAHAPASVAAVLLSTSPVFSLFVDRIAVGTPITARALLGTAIAVAGVGLLTVAET